MHDNEAVTNESSFDGGVLEYIGVSLAMYFLIVITLTLGLPWAISFRQRWLTNHTIIDGRRLSFDGTGAQLFGNWLVILFFCIITLGIYGFWASIRIQKWIVKHTHFSAI